MSAAIPTPTVSPSPVIEISNLRHVYKTHVAVAGVTFNVNAGSIHGFVGPNGAGKTTTLKVLATLMAPQSGSVRVLGRDIYTERKTVRRKIGYMPDHFSMYRQMTVFEYLDFFGAAYGLKSGERDKVINDVLALTDMEGRRNDFVQGLSRGMQQRVSLARVLVHDPQLLLLDEPASGLDPRARIELMEILQELRNLGKTIFISSHILSELAELCDSVTILDRGVVKYTGSMRGLMIGDAATAAYVIELSAAFAPMLEALKLLSGVIEVRQDDARVAKYQVVFDPVSLEPGAVLKCALEAGAPIIGFVREMKHLNQAFMDLTEAGVRS